MSETLNTPKTDYQALGSGKSRIDGELKITGAASYAVEQERDNMLYGVVIQSTISSGRISKMDTAEAAALPGVLAIYTHESGLKINTPTAIAEGGAAQTTYVPLQDDVILHNGQNIGIAIAETFEQATAAAARVHIEYEETPAILFQTDPQAKPQQVDSSDIALGDADKAMQASAVRIKHTYTTPREYNMPMELHACIADWQGHELTLWEPSQWVSGSQTVISEWFDLPRENVRIISPYVGGGFGSKPVPYTHVALASVASRELKRPVKVVLTRPQTFTGFGGRPATSQTLEMGADHDGKINAIIHEGMSETSLNDAFAESCNKVTALMYAIPNVTSKHSVVPINTVTPGWMRAPGENPSTFGLEVAIDEMAYELGIDPLELRLRNWADHDYKSGIPWTTRRLKEAYAAGARAFGWDKRSAKPRSMREGHELIGWGMAAGTYPVSRMPAEARLTLQKDGSFLLQSGGVDLGTGTYTILAQTVAEVLQVSSSRVKVQLGDTRFPLAGVAGGSQLAGNLTTVTHKAALQMRERLVSLAATQAGSPLEKESPSALLLVDGSVSSASQPERAISLSQLIQLAGLQELQVDAHTFKDGTSAEDRKNIVSAMEDAEGATAGDVSAHSWSAQFVEVRVDEDFGTVRVSRMVGAFDSGRLYNPKLARSQWIGGMIMGLGQALMEEGQVDPRNGRVINNNLADYMVAINADVPEIITLDVGEPDYQATGLGGKAVGELGIVGVAAAFSNAVYHATGKRVRDLPITLDKLI
ncbi:xanthine dehydrogenase family protein molybdopterin-binding subunit [Rouxiella chamberiensis]|uniref:Xanthine dehydrogenase family protein molybdopterin-binding subunit n=1 Tax=Rouxiella chamberiensis TaxID=1513468 RepID=A0ABY7HTK8_9GAMM|nr:xanthine dehydrogenase family protein molybdopterin-binding subunit [Rouxiella chamberiensis]WAT02156.1 xanthine dehydrogenase family protein molybdopterin-binding subunit [Rouxiella chamberiensis]